MTKEQKQGLNIALDILNASKRFDLSWEWMEEGKDGEYVKYEQVKSKIIRLLKEGN